MAKPTSDHETTTKETAPIDLERDFAAPPERVWAAWTDPKRLVRWWAPHGWTTPHCTVDLRVGGVFHFCMRPPEGADVWARGIYQIVEPARHLAYLSSFSDPAGELVEWEGYPTETRVDVRFEAIAAGTRVHLRHIGMPPGRGEREGWLEMFERLADVVSTPANPEA